MVTSTAPTRTEVSLAAADLEGIRIGRDIRLEVHYRHRSWDGGSYSGIVETHYIHDNADWRQTQAKFKSGDWKPVKLKRTTFLRFRFVPKDPQIEIPEIILAYPREWQAVWNGFAAVDFNRYVNVFCGSFRIVQAEPEAGRARGWNFYLPFGSEKQPGLLHHAVRAALRRPWDLRGIQWTTFAFNRRRLRHWEKVGKLSFEGDALARYLKFHARPYNDQGLTLKDGMAHLVHIAAGYSQNRGDPCTVRVWPDGQDSFYWAISDRQGKRRGMNGGVIWHGDYYSTHT